MPRPMQPYQLSAAMHAAYNKWTGYEQGMAAKIYMANSISRHYGACHLLGLSLHPGSMMSEFSKYWDDSDLERVDMKFLGPSHEKCVMGCRNDRVDSPEPAFQCYKCTRIFDRHREGCIAGAVYAGSRLWGVSTSD